LIVTPLALQRNLVPTSQLNQISLSNIQRLDTPIRLDAFNKVKCLLRLINDTLSNKPNIRLKVATTLLDPHLPCTVKFTLITLDR